MDLYIMRHGTTVWNERGLIQGRSKNRLSKAGVAKAEQSAERLKNEDFNIIICSPLVRTMQTANIMNKYHGVKIIKDERLIEIDQGIFTGRAKASLTDEEKRLKKEGAPGTLMESRDSVAGRTKNFLDELKSEKRFNSVLVVTHNINASIMDALLLGKPLANLRQNFDNAEVRKYTIE